MKKYTSIKELVMDLDKIEQPGDLVAFERELIPLLELLEKINPCGQSYEMDKDWVLISYFLKLNLFNFLKIPAFKMQIQMIGLPVSLSEKGYWGDEAIIEDRLKQRKGLKILVNGNEGFKTPGRTLSTFCFENKFASFDDYLQSLRSPYRRRLKKALGRREEMLIKKFDRSDFSEAHYKLYRSIMDRTKNPLEVLPIDFFREYEAELVEFIQAETKEIIGFIQLKEVNNRLIFLFGGFRKQDNDDYDIYYNMLLKIIEIGIEKKAATIEFGQTAEESKLKIGCVEVEKYLTAHHSNPLLNWMIQSLLPVFSYKPYKIKHHVFKDTH